MFVVIDIHVGVKIFRLQFVGTVMLFHSTQWRRPASSLHCTRRSREIDAILHAAQETFILKKLRMAEGYAR